MRVLLFGAIIPFFMTAFVINLIETHGSEDLRNWFVRYETLLFKLRWDQLQKNERLLFMEQSGFNYSPIPAQEKDALLPLLRNASCGLFLQQQPQTQAAIAMLEKDLFYKVPFEKVPDLVGRREVYIEAGEAYIPQSCLISVVVAEFKSHLMQALEVCYSDVELCVGILVLSCWNSFRFILYACIV